MGTTTETTKHTAGPWQIGVMRNVKIAERSLVVVALKEAQVGAHGPAVCIVGPIGEDGYAISEDEANADLLAAAPDLLAACKALCKRLESNELVNRPHDPCNQYDQPAYDAALAAIAKAEGTTP